MPSPWVETEDPYLRSTLMSLTDAGVLNGPANIYPLRWSLINDVSFDPTSSLSTELAQFMYSMRSAQLNRGNKRVSLSGGSESISNVWFGDVKREKWAVESSYQYMANSYAFRLNTSYVENNGDPKVSWHDSYFAFNAGRVLFDISTTSKWWGQGWNHNLILASTGDDLDSSLSWMADSHSFGVWSVNAMFSKLDKKDYEYRASVRLVNRLFHGLEWGLSQHYWFDSKTDKPQSAPKQTGFDWRIVMPDLLDTQHVFYGELASSQRSGSGWIGASMVGWSIYKPIGRNSVRVVVERQVMDDEEQQSLELMGLGDYLSSSYLLTDSWSISSYIQLDNDHRASITAAKETSIGKQSADENKYQLSYQIPVFDGMLTWTADYISLKNQDSKWYVWSSYEFRF